MTTFKDQAVGEILFNAIVFMLCLILFNSLLNEHHVEPLILKCEA